MSCAAPTRAECPERPAGHRFRQAGLARHRLEDARHLPGVEPRADAPALADRAEQHAVPDPGPVEPCAQQAHCVRTDPDDQRPGLLRRSWSGAPAGCRRPVNSPSDHVFAGRPVPPCGAWCHRRWRAGRGCGRRSALSPAASSRRWRSGHVSPAAVALPAALPAVHALQRQAARAGSSASSPARAPGGRW